MPLLFLLFIYPMFVSHIKTNGGDRNAHIARMQMRVSEYKIHQVHIISRVSHIHDMAFVSIKRLFCRTITAFERNAVASRTQHKLGSNKIIIIIIVYVYLDKWRDTIHMHGGF